MAQGSGEVGEGPVQTAKADGIPSAQTSDEIRAQIEQTRADMSDTIDAIQSRLSPKRVLADAKDSVTEATVGRVKRLTQRPDGSGRGVLQGVRDNPLPVALLATAALGLLMRALTNGKRRRRDRSMPATPVQHVGAGRAWSASDTISRERRSPGRLLAAAGAGAACWALWRAQTAAPNFSGQFSGADDPLIASATAARR
jgi:hypothetical protein